MITINSVIPPRLYKANDNKTYVLPSWIEVSDDTTMDDVEWIKPHFGDFGGESMFKIADKIIPIWRPEMGENKYNTRFDVASNKYLCGCPGFWRAKGECKHVKALKESK
jgi:hypothetical protein